MRFCNAIFLHNHPNKKENCWIFFHVFVLRNNNQININIAKQINGLEVFDPWFVSVIHSHFNLSLGIKRFTNPTVPCSIFFTKTLKDPCIWQFKSTCVYFDLLFDLKGPGGSGAGGGSGGGSNRWSGLWGLSGAKDSKMDALVHQLDTYSRLGIPRVPHHPHVMAGGSQQLHQNQSINIQDVEDEVEEGKNQEFLFLNSRLLTEVLLTDKQILSVAPSPKRLELCNFFWIHICMHLWNKTVSRSVDTICDWNLSYWCRWAW